MAAISAPLMVAGLIAVAVAQAWAARIGGGAMVIGASLALALTGLRARALAWALAAFGAVAVALTWLLSR